MSRVMGRAHFSHLLSGTPAIASEPAVAPRAGVTRLVKPSPNWNAETARLPDMPRLSAIGLMMGIRIAIFAEADGTNRFRKATIADIPTEARPRESSRRGRQA